MPCAFSAEEARFLTLTAGRLAALSNVVAVSLGGSRTQGTHHAESDWDFAIYYRGDFNPGELRATGWPGDVSEVGEWGQVFNGGAWLTIDGRRSDIHYRDLAAVDRALEDARAGRFTIQPLMFHLAGIPTYLVLAELALGRVLSGELPAPDYPSALRDAALTRWRDRAMRTFGYAIDSHARAGRVVEFAGLIAQAVAQSAHAVLAAQGVWVTNDKQLLARAGLHGLDTHLGQLGRDPDLLTRIGQSISSTCQDRIKAASADR